MHDTSLENQRAKIIYQEQSSLNSSGFEKEDKKADQTNIYNVFAVENIRKKENK